MMDLNPDVAGRRQFLLDEAAQERLAALVPPAPSVVRHELASACFRLASWLETDRYGQPVETGGSDWVTRGVSA